MNLKLEYFTRDAYNSKEWIELILPGPVTEMELKTIREEILGGPFAPSDLRLPHVGIRPSDPEFDSKVHSTLIEISDVSLTKENPNVSQFMRNDKNIVRSAQDLLTQIK